MRVKVHRNWKLPETVSSHSSFPAPKSLSITSSGLEKNSVYRSLIFPSPSQLNFAPNSSGQDLGLSMQPPQDAEMAARAYIAPKQTAVVKRSSSIR